MGTLTEQTIASVMSTNDFGLSYYKTDLAKEWLKNRNYSITNSEEKSTPAKEIVEIRSALEHDDVICKVHGYNQSEIEAILQKKVVTNEIKPLDRSKLLNRFAKTIEENIKVITEMEILIRGMPVKDTQIEVKRLVEYLSYYSSFTFRTKEVPDFKPKLIETFITRNIGLSTLGAILGPALAAGHNVAIIGDTTISAVATLIVELAVKAGVPDTSIKCIPSIDVTKNNSYLRVTGHEGIQVNRLKIPMIIFDDADIDSACDAAISAAWGHLGTLPESVGLILVQENKFNVVVDKLKTLVNNLSHTPLKATNKSAKISNTIDKNIIKNFQQHIKDAKSLGIEVYQANKTLTDYQPTLIIGGQAKPNDVLEGDKLEDTSGNTLTIVSFRSLDEAISLANNTRQGYAASIWSEHLALTQEMASKLNVSNVWINGHGEFSADIVIVPRKSSGFGYIGGEEGFLPYLYCTSNNIRHDVINPSNSHKMSKDAKIKLLQNLADYLQENKKKLKDNLKEQWIETLPDAIYECISKDNVHTTNSNAGFFSVTPIREPVGVVTLLRDSNPDTYSFNVLIESLFQGNYVTVVSNNHAAFYEDIAKQLPKILTVQKKINQNTDCNITNLQEIIRRVTCIKNIWSNHQHNFK